MGPSGTRRFLQPALYFAVAALAHGLLFLIPGGWGKTETGMMRGVRIRVQGEARVAAAPPKPTPAVSAPVVPTPSARNEPALGGDRGGGGATSGSGGGASGNANAGAGDAGISTDSHAVGNAPTASEYGSYLARLKSEGVQGWARESAGKARQGWKGAGKSDSAWGGGARTGTGTGKGSGSGSGGGYLDPRVRMVVTSYPPTGIETHHTQVRYPEIRIKKHEIVAGWWNVYIRLRTDGNGNVIESIVLRPETDGALEKIFVSQVRREIEKWTFDPKEAEINVDVRFYVE